MRRQRYLRASSAQSICIFCTWRLTADLPPALSTTSRRHLNTGRHSRQYVGAATAEAPSDNGNVSQPSQSQQQRTFDPSSSLTRSEQAERARLRQLREERERAQHQVIEARRRQQEETRLAILEQREAEALRERGAQAAQKRQDDEEREKLARQWREQQAAAGAAAGAKMDADAQRQRLGWKQRNQERNQSRAFRKYGAEGPEADGQGTSQSSGQTINVRKLVLREDVGPRPTARSQRRQQGRVQGGQPRHEQHQGRGNPRYHNQSGNTQPSYPSARRDDPNARTTGTTTPKVSLPTFRGAGPASQTAERLQDDGWGSGAVQRAPVNPLDQDVERRYDNILAERPVTAEPPSSNPNFATANGPTADFGYRGNPLTRQSPARQTPYEPRRPERRQSDTEQDSIDMWEQQAAPSQAGQSRRPAYEQQSRNSQEFQGFGRDAQVNSQQQPQRRTGRDVVATLQDGPQRESADTKQRYEPLQYGRARTGRDRSLPARDAQYSPVGARDTYHFRPNASSVTDDQSPPETMQRSEPYSPQRERPSPSAWQDDLDQPPSYNSTARHCPDATQPPPRQPISVKNIGSYQPPPQPKPHSTRQDDYAMYDSNGYRANMLDAQDYQQAHPAFDEAQATEWQHLRRRKSVPAQPTSSSPPAYLQQQHQQREPFHDPAWIDRQFREHVQQRPQQTYPAYLDQQQSAQQRDQSSPFDSGQTVRQVQGRKCARCGETGHSARECTGPNRATCHRCGQVGHMGFECPSSSGPRPGFVRRTRSQGPEYEDYVRRPAPGSSEFVEDRGQRRPDPFDAQEEPRRAQVGRREDAVDDVREGLLRPRKAAEDEEGEDEGPAERILRSRKFAEDALKREKARGGRRRNEDDEEEDEGAAAREDRNARKANRKAQKAQEKAAEKAEKKARKAEQGSPVNLPEFVSVATLAQQLGVRYEHFVGQVERLGYDDVFPGKILNAETSGMIAMEYGFEPVFGEARAAAEEEERDLKARPEVAQEDTEFLPTRPPVVTIMGHVDHGKTTILDYLRKSSVAAGEAGGITQHIGAFSVPLASNGRTITFLDTPGHAAFLAMRQRGANVTDIVILVVAADDSVKPQTLEAIKHAQTAGVPMIVAVNKIDKEEADLQRVKQDLARHGVEIEDFGGETQVVPVSAKTGEGMDELEENVVTLSEILDHRAETDGAVEGWVLEATTKKAGRVATVLVRRGTLKPGAVIVAGKTWGRVKTLQNEAGQLVLEVGPGMPVEVGGWRDQPAAGDEVLQAPTEQKATDVVEYRLEKEEQKKIAEDMEAINKTRRLEQERQKKERAAEAAKNKGGDAYFEAAAQADEAANAEDQSTGQLTVPLIIKADVSGSAEAVSAYVLSVSSPLIAPQILRSTVGPLNESDVELADAARGHIIAFNLPADENMKAQAASKGVKVLENNVIYRVLDDVKAVMEERLPAVVRQSVLGEAEVGVGFEIGVGGRKKVRIAGCKIRNGVVGRGSRVRVTRGDQKVYDGTISSLKNTKKEVQEMRKGAECGMGFEDWEAFEVGDQVQTYEEISEKRKL